MSTYPAEQASDESQQARGDVAAPLESELLVEGMHCASCASRVQRTLTREAGVAEARVNFATNHASVVYDPRVVSVDDNA